jgi:hypothetical protein
MITDAMPPLLHCLEQYATSVPLRKSLRRSWASVVESLLTFRPLGVVLERIVTPRLSCVQNTPLLSADGFRESTTLVTIENKGPIPLEFRKAIGDRVYGCDDCLEACPWNRFAAESNELRFRLPEQVERLSLRELASLSEVEFRALFRHSSIKRINCYWLLVAVRGGARNFFAARNASLAPLFRSSGTYETL